MTPLLTRLQERRATRDAAPEAFNRRLTAPLILGAVLNPINSSMIAVALVPIAVYFGAPAARTAWLVSGLYLATAVGQPVVGRLVDRYGPRPLYLVGTALVGVAGVVGALAPSLGVLIGSRVLLGIGTCAGYPAAMYLLRSESRRTGQDSPNRILTALAVSTQTVAVIGPSLGGLLIGVAGWRAIFAVNIPLSVACLILGALRLPHFTEARRGRFVSTVDLLGMVLFGTMLSALMLFLMAPEAGHWYLLLGAIAVGVAFAVWELRVAEPFLDLRVLGGNLPQLATYWRNLLTFIVSYAFLYGYTPWLEAGRGLNASATGLLLLPMFGTAIVVASITGRYKEVWWKLLVGSTTQIVACGLLLLVGSTTPIWALVGIAFIVGVPQGLNSLANQNALYYQADPARMGSSAGLLRTFTYLGAMVASAANAAFYAGGVTTPGMHDLARFMLPCAFLLLVATIADRTLRRIGRTESSAVVASAVAVGKN